MISVSQPSGATLCPADAQVRAIGETLAAAMSTRRGLRARVDDRAMAWIARDPELLAALFRFVDVRPACRGTSDLAGHLAGFLSEVTQPAPPVNAGRRLARHALSRRAVGATAAVGVRAIAGRFIAGEDERAALPLLESLWNRGVGASIDLLGEATITDAEGEHYAKRCLATLDVLARQSGAWKPRALLETDAAGPLARVNLSVKLSALTPHLRSEAPARGIADATVRLRRLLRRARELGAHLHIDMESLDHREAVLWTTLELLAEDEFREGPSAGIVHQAYLRYSNEQLDEILRWAHATPRSHPLTIRLVKGAYWDHEWVQAQQNGWDVPVFEQRDACDRNFEALTRRLIGEFPRVRLAVASHNLRSVAHAIACQRAAGLGPADVEYQVLRGLGDDLQDALTAEGLRARTYCPIGDLVAGMAYLVRRLLENTSNESFLRARAEGQDLHDLLRSP